MQCSVEPDFCGRSGLPWSLDPGALADISPIPIELSNCSVAGEGWDNQLQTLSEVKLHSKLEASPMPPSVIFSAKRRAEKKSSEPRVPTRFSTTQTNVCFRTQASPTPSAIRKRSLERGK
jgi:hypothetical protein